jgi:prepilin-type N-terminal cleavage/methylation domain-containing protein
MTHINPQCKMKGFTLIEVVVSLFVFSLLMIAVSQTFAVFIQSYREARSIQRDVENIQYVLNSLSKELRTSTVISSNSSSMKFYDYSQKECMQYRIASGSLSMRRESMDDIDTCTANDISGSYTAVSSGTVTGSMIVDPSTISPLHVGKITFSFKITEDNKHTAYIQTTVSLRDFGYIEL